MTPCRAAVVINRIEQERSQKYLGTANIRIQSLEFPISESEKLKHHLKLRFLQQGCRTSKDLRHRLNATISQNDLHTALETSNVSCASLLDDSPPYTELEFPPDFRLQCLHGKAVIKAAEEAFDDENERWLVNLYHPGEHDTPSVSLTN